MDKFLASFGVPAGFRLVEMKNQFGGHPYRLVFSEQHSDYEAWAASLEGPDRNAELLMSHLDHQGTLIDVGANIGTVSAPVAANGSAVIAIEMAPTNCLKLWAVAAANNFHEFHVVQAAASDHDGIIAFEGDEAWGHVNHDGRGTQAVCLRLDSFIHRFDISTPLAIKIDVEGHEAAVLQGASETLSIYRPIVMFEAIEIGEQNWNSRLSKTILEKSGYQLFEIRGNALCPKTSLDIQEGCVADFLAVPAERRSDLGKLNAEVRPLTDEEQILWVSEMATFPMDGHQRHAASVVLRWEREAPHLCKKGRDLIPILLALDHLEDLHPELRRIAV